MIASGTVRLDRSRINREPVREGTIDWTVRDARLDADADVEFETGRLTADAGATSAAASTSSPRAPPAASG
jgi:hypothetical protein